MRLDILYGSEIDTVRLPTAFDRIDRNTDGIVSTLSLKRIREGGKRDRGRPPI